MCLSVSPPPPGLNYESCPTSEDCENNAVDSFWKRASMQVVPGPTAGRLSTGGSWDDGTEGFRDWAT